MLKLISVAYSTLQAAGRGEVNVCDVIFEGGSRKV